MTRSTGLQLLCTLLFSATVLAQGYAGVDYPNGDLSKGTASSALSCAQQCDTTAGCAGWSWDSCGGVTCWLKKSIGPQSSNTCRVSGVRQGEIGIDRPGFDMPGSPVAMQAGSTAINCVALCNTTYGCVAWSYGSSSSCSSANLCYLKSWAGATRVNSTCMTSGVLGTTGVDAPGFTSVAITTNGASTTTACANECEATSGCIGWSFTNPISGCGSPNSCYLKTSIPGQLTPSVCSSVGLSSRYYTTGGGQPLIMNNAFHIGNQTDSHLAPQIPGRDGGAIGNIGGKIVWFWSDTGYSNCQYCFYGNTGAIGDPRTITNVTGPRRQAIPFVGSESQMVNNVRCVLWPTTGPVEVTPGVGAMYVPKGYWNNSNFGGVNGPNMGMEYATVTIGTDGYPNVTRQTEIPIFPTSVPSFGSVAIFKDNNYLYLYSGDSVATYQTNHFCARVPLSSSSQISSYQYWNAATLQWSSTVPLKNATSQTSLTSTFGIGAGVYYNSYARVWVMLLSYKADIKIYMRTSFYPQGPWVNQTLLYTPPPSYWGYVYGTVGTNLYDTSGSTAAVQFTWGAPGGDYVEWDISVAFQAVQPTTTSVSNVVDSSGESAAVRSFGCPVLAILVAVAVSAILF